jgi:hypothetical protein
MKLDVTRVKCIQRFESVRREGVIRRGAANFIRTVLCQADEWIYASRKSPTMAISRKTVSA